MRLVMNKLLFLFLLMAGSAQGQWQMVAVPTTASLRGLIAVDEKIVWAAGTSGVVLRTVDGGASWQVHPIAVAEKLDFRGIWAFDASTAVAMSSGKAEEGMARIYRTTDGGVHWSLSLETKTPGIFFDALAFWDRKRGIVMSDPVKGRFVIFVTEDGGMTWKQTARENIPPALPNEGAFAASNSCLTAQGSGNVWFGTGGASVARIFRSNNGGQSWAVAETPMRPSNASSGIFSVAFRDAQHGVASGGDYAHPGSTEIPNVLFTTDGGKSWSSGEPTVPAGVYLSSVAYRSEKEGPASKSRGSILAAGIAGIFSKDAGKEWIKEIDGEFNAVAAARDGSAWAVGPKGRVARLKAD
jgi:photosystem II stability/assembly factor-like uncharacterized protein